MEAVLGCIVGSFLTPALPVGGCLLVSLGTLTGANALAPQEITQITDCEELQNINLDLSGNYELLNDIDCSDTQNWNNGAGFLPIGDSDQNSFKGTFDGHNYIISNLYIYRPSTDKVGLFGDVYGKAVNVGLENVQITGHVGVGALVGWNVGGTILNSYSTGSITGVGNAVGGLIGQSSGIVSECYSTADVIGDGYTGGLVVDLIIK